MRDIDAITEALSEAHPEIEIEQLRVSRPTDDDGLWFFRHPRIAVEVQLESSDGTCPFLFETTANDSRRHARTIAEAISLVTEGLGLTARSTDP